MTFPVFVDTEVTFDDAPDDAEWEGMFPKVTLTAQTQRDRFLGSRHARVGWAQGRLLQLEKEDLCGFVFKSRSPSSGMRGVKVYTPSGMPSTRGVSIFAGAFMKGLPLIPVEDDGRLHDPALRENFIERIFVFKRWKEFKGKGGVLRDLIAFHSDHKLLILAHSPKHYTVLGQLYGEIKVLPDNFFRFYRQEYDTPYINKKDNRMTPNTFEGYSFQGAYGGKDGAPGLRYASQPAHHRFSRHSATGRPCPAQVLAISSITQP